MRIKHIVIFFLSQGFHHQNSNGTEGGGTSSDLEDHIASQILNEFPEIRSYVGQIIDGNL